MPGIKMINIGKSLSRSIGEQNGKGNCDIKYFVSDDAESFKENAAAYLGRELKESVEKIDIQNY